MLEPIVPAPKALRKADTAIQLAQERGTMTS
jgi:hypothetical protein